jgi:dCTP diphosphatase
MAQRDAIQSMSDSPASPPPDVLAEFRTKNLAMALSVEAAELLEHFQWLSDAESSALSPETRSKVAEELADVLLYLIRLADKLDVDLVIAASEKLKVNAAKYPADKARGSSKKYSEL